MHGSASGPLGALLLIVPLAAIPVFAIVGVPQFAPLIASPSEDEDVADLGELNSPLSSPAVDTPRKGRSADDLFAPFPDSPSRSDALPPPRTDTRPLSGPNTNAEGPRKLASSLPPPDALDQWEIRPVAPHEFTRPVGNALPPEAGAPSVPPADASEALQIPLDETVDGQVSAVGFSPDLLKPDPGSRAAKEARTAPRRGPPEAPLTNRASPRKNQDVDSAHDLSPSAEARPQSLAERTGWQAAASRLKELGIHKYRLESQIEEQSFIFTCTFSSPENPRVTQRFEDDADNPLEAVQKVLRQIDEWRSRDNRTKLAALPAEEDR